MNFASISFGSACAAFALLTLLLTTSWNGQRQGARIISASLASSLWAGVLAWYVSGAREVGVMIFLAECVRDGAWLYVLTGIAAPVLARGWLLAALAAWGAFTLSGSLYALAGFPAWGDWNAHLALSRAGLAISVIALLILEQIYRNVNAFGREAARPLVLGVGGLFAYDLILYSQAEVLGWIDPDTLLVRGLVNVAIVPLIALAARSQPLWSVDIFVSRQFVLYTSSLAAIGGYLVLLALGAYYVRLFGGTWGGAAQLVFLLLGGTGLATLVLSEQVRRRAKVFLSKHFYRNKYDYRLEWLRFIETLSGSDQGDVRRVGIHAIAQIFSSPSAFLFTRVSDGDRYVPAVCWPKLVQSPTLSDIPGSSELVRILRERQWIVDLEEVRADPALRAQLALPTVLLDSREVRIISPLLHVNTLIGFVVLGAPPEPFELTYEDRDLLRTVGRHVATHLAQYEANLSLSEARQFEAYNKLTAFVMHDLKNSVAQLQLIVANAQRHKHNPAFIDDVIETTENTVERMTRLIEQLRDPTVTSSRTVLLPAVLEAALKRCAARKPTPHFESEPPEEALIADQERLTAIFEHVIRNAQDATPEGGSIRVFFRSTAEAIVVSIADEGIGMAQEFVRERLFRPFDSTKGSKGMGIGAYQVREYVRMLGGQVEVQSSPGKGTIFSITLPIAQPRAVQAIASNQ